MSAPHTDLEKQARRHRGPLQGMFAVVLFALVLLAILGFWAFGRGGDPDGAEVQVQTGTGVVEEGGAGDAVTANDFAEEEQGAGTGGAVDPTAVEVPSLEVPNPQTGTNETVNPLVAPSEAALPPDPVTPAPEAAEQAAGNEPAAAEPSEEPPVAIIPGEE